mmetsp:Transcript_111691/g.215140  ORF Transcript_111691/g.215140 Transcript_111691/m.215140 type:complete len:92 (+) Transcript_111691:115-390(+)
MPSDDCPSRSDAFKGRVFCVCCGQGCTRSPGERPTAWTISASCIRSKAPRYQVMDFNETRNFWLRERQRELILPDVENVPDVVCYNDKQIT